MLLAVEKLLATGSIYQEDQNTPLCLYMIINQL